MLVINENHKKYITDTKEVISTLKECREALEQLSVGNIVAGQVLPIINKEINTLLRVIHQIHTLQEDYHG